MFLEGKKASLLKEMRAEMAAAATELKFEKAAPAARRRSTLLETLDRRGELDTHVQPEVFYIDPKKGLAGLKKVLKLDETAAHDRRGRHRAPGRGRNRGQPGAVHRRSALQAGLQAIQDSRRFRHRRFCQHSRSRGRRFKRLEDEGEVFPDLLLVDGGRGQLNAALAAFRELSIEPPMVISLAKREEEVYLRGFARSAATQPAFVRAAAAAIRA